MNLISLGLSELTPKPYRLLSIYGRNFITFYRISTSTIEKLTLRNSYTIKKNTSTYEELSYFVEPQAVRHLDFVVLVLVAVFGGFDAL